MYRLFVFAVLVLFVSGCATGRLPDEAQKTVGKIGVVALLGNDLSLVHTGISGFTSNAVAVDVTDWDLDRFVVESLSDLLRQRDYQVVDTAYTQQELQSIYVPGPEALDWRPDRVAAQLREVARQSGADTLILVLRRASPDFIHVSHDDDEYYRESLVGFGLYDRRTVISHVTTATFANFMLMMVDGETLRLVGKGTAQRYTPVGDEIWHEAYAKKNPKLVAEGTDLLRDKIEDVVSVALEEAAVTLKL